MPQSENANQKNDEKHPNGLSATRLIRRLLASAKQSRRLVQWSILVALATGALGAVANHFMSETTADRDQQKPRQNPPDSTWNGHQSNWWSRSDTEESPSNGPGETTNKAIITGSNAVSTSPTTPHASLPHFSAGAVLLRDNPAPIESNPAARYFAFAGPAWMKIAPLATATRPSPNPSNSSSKSGKSSKKGQSVWESPIQVTWTEEATSNQNSKNSTGSSGNSNETPTSSAGGKAIPVNHGYQLGGGELYLNNQGPATAKSSEPTYALLGLATGSTPQSAVTQDSSTDTADELHFSLAGQLATVPTLGVSDGTPVTNFIPEPATGVMVLAGVAVLFSRRRRVRPVA